MRSKPQTASTKTVRGRERIISEIRNILHKKGAQNHLISSFILKTENEICSEFASKKNDELAKLISHPIEPKGKIWVASYKVVLQYLLNHHMQATLECIDKEMTQSFGLTSENILVHGQQKYRNLMKCSPTSFFKKTVNNHM